MTNAEPYKVKTVEPSCLIRRGERQRILEEASYNPFLVRSQDVFIDLLTDSGTNAMSADQWAGLMSGEESFAGSRNFFHLEKAVHDLFGYPFMIPVHQGRGAENLLCRTLIQPGQRVAANLRFATTLPHIEHKGGVVTDIVVDEAFDPDSEHPFKGNLDIGKLEKLYAEVGKEGIAFILASATCNLAGGQPISVENLRQVSEWARAHGIPLLLDASRISENALLISERESQYLGRSPLEIVLELTRQVDICFFSAKKGALANIGGFVATRSRELYNELIQQGVVYEGMPTCGGLPSRELEAIARGLYEAIDERFLLHRIEQIRYLGEQLEKEGIPIVRPIGGHAVYVNATRFMSHLSREQFPAHALNAALYLEGGLRGSPATLPLPSGEKIDFLRLYIPRRVYTDRHLDVAADTLFSLFKKRESIPGLALATEKGEKAPKFAQSKYVPLQPAHLARGNNLETSPQADWAIRTRITSIPPYRIRTVEPLHSVPREQRLTALRTAGYNTFLLRSEDVTIDLLTDSGTNAMSLYQWSRYMLGDEAYAGSASFHELCEAVKEVFSFRHVFPTHQGRAAENILASALVKEGSFVPANMYFTTTREHIERNGGTLVDVILDEAHDPAALHPFKGNFSLEKLETLIRDVGAQNIPFIWLAVTVTMAGGQPVSMANIREVSRMAVRYDIPLYLDATHCVENAFFIKEREPGYGNRSIASILTEMSSYADGCVMSAKKDAQANIGGFIATNDEELHQRVSSMFVLFEGMSAYGGLSGRDMEAIAQGIREMVDDEMIAHRMHQVRFFGRKLEKAGVPIVEPIGGHAVFLDAARFLPHLSQDQFPAQTLAAALYLDSGVRSMERGIVSAGRDPSTGEHNYPKLELLRLAVPRRTYSDRHLEAVAEAVISLWEKRHEIGGLSMVYEPKSLRFFTARFQPLPVGILAEPKKRATGPLI
ncbi:MAG TPA: tryptophanase [Chroococcales cyanobacterium]|jgi:tyrosine phenol-lyase